MGVRTGTIVKFYTKENEFINRYNLDDRSDDYMYDGLICSGGLEFKPDKYGEFTEEEKEIMKIYFDEKSMSVLEGYTRAKSNIQSPEKLLPIWITIRSSIIEPLHSGLSSYHNQIIADFKVVKEEVDKHNNSKKGFFSKNTLDLPELTKLKSEHEFQDIIWRTIWKIDSISKIIALLIVAIQNDVLVEITASDY